MTAGDYLVWAAEHACDRRSELLDGKAVAMAPERARHAAVKLDVAMALRQALAISEIDCTVFGDGMSIVVDEYNVYEPDAVVQCGHDWQPDDVLLERPLLVVEVTSPSTRSKDAGAKLAGYLGLESVRHYLLLDPESRVIVHHRKADDSTIATRILHEGTLELDPPGVHLDVDDCFASLRTR